MPEIDARAAPTHCRSCQQPLNPLARFCRHCGHSVVDDFGPGARITAVPTPTDFESRWRDIRIVGWVFGLLLAASFVFSLVARQYRSPWVDVLASTADALLIVGFAIARRNDLHSLFGLPRCDRRMTWILAGLSLSFIVVMNAYFNTLKHLGIPMLRLTDEYRNAGWSVRSIYLMISVMPAVFEEIGFRGVIQSVLERTVSARDAWLIQAALFSVMHISPIVFPSHFVMGLVFGYLRLRTRSLYPGMLLHAGWNALQVFQEL